MNVDGLIRETMGLTFFPFLNVPLDNRVARDKVYSINVPVPPAKFCERGELFLGYASDGRRDVHRFMLGLDEVRRHVFICGATGTGKSSFLQAFLVAISKAKPDVPFLVVELKGEYGIIARHVDGVSFLEPGINFSLDLFNFNGDPLVHAEKVFDLLRSSFDLLAGHEFSPQMERVLVDVMYQTMTDPVPARRSFQGLISNGRRYIEQHETEIPGIRASWIAIENRLRRFTTGPLKRVYRSEGDTPGLASILESKVIVNLDSIIRLGGTKDDLRFFTNMLLKGVWDANMARGPARDMKHLTLIDDAQYFGSARQQGRTT